MSFGELFAFDNQYIERRGNPLCGTDEAGRGPLAGPVCCAAVVLRPDAVIEGLDDSKKLSPKKREELFDVIIESCVSHSVVFIDNETIDSINILQASLMGMARAAEFLSVAPAFILIDGNAAIPTGIACEPIIKGDTLSASIAAASILAKVNRDRLMCEYDERYPGYGFAKHKGYPTKEHYEAIDRLGITPIHRRSFLRGRV